MAFLGLKLGLDLEMRAAIKNSTENPPDTKMHFCAISALLLPNNTCLHTSIQCRVCVVECGWTRKVQPLSVSQVSLPFLPFSLSDVQCTHITMSGHLPCRMLMWRILNCAFLTTCGGHPGMVFWSSLILTFPLVSAALFAGQTMLTQSFVMEQV